MNQRILAYETSELDLTTLLRFILHIILITPSLVNISSRTLTLGLAVVQSAARPVLVVSHWEFPKLLDLDFDIFVFAAGSHTIVRFREGKKFYLN